MKKQLIAILAFASAISHAFAADIICTDYNNVCEIVNGEDIGVGWGVIQKWEVPA